MAENYHLTWNADKEGWDVKREGASRPSDHFADRGEALARAKELALNSNVSVIVHDESGAITGSLKDEELEPGFLKAAADKVKGYAGQVASRLS